MVKKCMQNNLMCPPDPDWLDGSYTEATKLVDGLASLQDGQKFFLRSCTLIALVLLVFRERCYTFGLIANCGSNDEMRSFVPYLFPPIDSMYVDSKYR